jgi:RNA polymerase sigma factor (sigma-70 family)
MWSLSDESLLVGLGSGDPEAAAAFVRRFQGRVFGLALTILGDPKAAEEVAQEAFLRAWQHCLSYDARRAQVATWLLSITRNLAIDQLRLRRYDPVDPEVFGASGWLDRGEGPEERGIAADDTRRLRAAIRSLPHDQRKALVLAAYYGRTAREIAELEHVPLGTIKTRIRTAMLKLRSAMKVSDEP